MLVLRRSLYAALLALCLLPGRSIVLAQHPVEIPRVETPREHPEFERKSETVKAPELDNGVGLELPRGDLRYEDALRDIRDLNAKKPPLVLRWEKSPDASGRTYAMDGSKRLDLDALRLTLEHGRMVINEGAPPNNREWRDLNAAYSGQIITHEPESANRDPRAIQAAIDLGGRALNASRVKVFNALPYESDLDAFMQEQRRMGIGGTPEYWKKLHDHIEANSGEMKRGTATKAALLEELRNGSSDVLMLYAHFDGQHLYMPGAHGGIISIRELEQIDRTKDPRVRERVIVLVACNGGSRTSENPHSLTSVLLAKGIARTVLAADRAFASHEIPGLLQKLGGRVPVRKAVALDTQSTSHSPGAATPARTGSFLQQYVELERSPLNETSVPRES